MDKKADKKQDPERRNSNDSDLVSIERISPNRSDQMNHDEYSSPDEESDESELNSRKEHPHEDANNDLLESSAK